MALNATGHAGLDLLMAPPVLAVGDGVTLALAESPGIAPEVLPFATKNLSEGW